MTTDEFRRRFPNASASTIAKNCPDGVVSSAVSQRSPGDEPVAEAPAENLNPTKRFVRVTSYRIRLLDERNLHEKAFIDALQTSGAIFDDSPTWCKVDVIQVKVEHPWEQRTLIEIFEI